MGGRIKFNRVDGGAVEGYLVRSSAVPAPGSHTPGVVMIQEWWGLQDQITGMADRLASAGFDVLAPDFYSGAVAPYHDAQAASREMNSLNFLDAVDNIVRGAALHLLQHSKKVGVIGFCMGGAMTVLAAARVAELRCAVAFYGLPPEEAARPRDVKIPLQGHFATKDDWCAPQAVKRFEDGLRAASKTYEFYSYDADHAFANEQRVSVHDRACAELAWSRTLAFFKRELA